jgi:hypothetical protein
MEYQMRKVPANAYGVRVHGWTNKINNVPVINVSDFDFINMYILDDVDRGDDVQGAGSARAVQHESCCNNMYHLFSNVVDDCNVHSVRMQAGQRPDDFTQYIAQELAKYTPRDLVIFYYHGKAGGKGDNYTWFVPHRKDLVTVVRQLTDIAAGNSEGLDPDVSTPMTLSAR